MSFRTFVLGVVLIGTFVMAASSPVVDTDTWWHLRAGDWILEQGAILRTDPFSLTRQGEPWVYPGWLAQLGMIGSYRWLGLTGLHLLTASVLTLTFALLWFTLEGGVVVRAFVLILAAVTSSIYWSARPQVASLALLAGCLLLLERYHKDRRPWIWLVPLLVALWPNLHGAYPAGLLLVAIYLAASALDAIASVWQTPQPLRAAWQENRKLLGALGLCLVLCVMALGLNPHGYAMLGYAGKTLSIGILREYIQEWQSPDFHTLRAQLFLGMLFLLFVAVSASRLHPSTREVLLVVVFGSMAFLAWRNVAMFALVAAPALSRHLNASLRRLPGVRGGEVPADRRRWVNVALILVWATLAGVLLTRFLNPERVQAQADRPVPVAAARFLRSSGEAGPLFNSYNWGGYVIWAMYPEHLSFVDGRTDLFDDEILEQYLTAWRGEEGWQEVLDRWDIRLALVEPDAPLTLRLEDAGWRRLYVDAMSSIWVRPDAG